MRTSSLLRNLAIVALFGAATQAAAATSSDCSGLLAHSFPTLESGKPRSLCEFSGKVVLVVNTASECGYTPQYEGLEALHKRYQGRGLVIVGFPSNDFGGQESGSNKQIAEFCKLNYGVSFPMFEKTTVIGARANPLYTELAQRAGAAPRWNFHKYLIDRSGSRVIGIESKIAPSHATFIREVERLLAEPDARRR